MKYFFKNNRLLGSSSSDMVRFDDYDAIKENLTDAQLQLISQGYIFQGDDLVAPEGRQEEQDKRLREEKRKEAERVILTKYPVYRQLNILRLGSPEELQAMSEYIDGIRQEFQKNGKDADFSSFIQ